VRGPRGQGVLKDVGRDWRGRHDRDRRSRRRRGTARLGRQDEAPDETRDDRQLHAKEQFAAGRGDRIPGGSEVYIRLDSLGERLDGVDPYLVESVKSIVVSSD
jgi:hypothetical protein